MGKQRSRAKGKSGGDGIFFVLGGWGVATHTVGGECKTENRREGVIAVSLERNRGICFNYSKETDKAPLTAASSCFLRLCHHMTPP